MEINELCKNFSKVTALNSVSIILKQGIHGLLGENGAGKTTLMRILATIIEPDSGTITHNGISWKDKEKVRRLIGYLPQKFAMYKQLTVRESLRHIAILKGIGDNFKQYVEDSIYSVNLEEKADSKIGTLSGGMLRRLGIAQAIIGDPEIIIVDEPTAGLDPEERIRFRLLLKKLATNKIVILSTHIVDDVEIICDTITILHKGKVITTGTSNEIKTNAENHIWEMQLAPKEYTEFIGLTTDNLVIDQKFKDGLYCVRLLSKSQPSDSSTLVKPSLEEAYMWLIKNQDI